MKNKVLTVGDCLDTLNKEGVVLLIEDGKVTIVNENIPADR